MCPATSVPLQGTRRGEKRGKEGRRGEKRGEEGRREEKREEDNESSPFARIKCILTTRAKLSNFVRFPALLKDKQDN